MRRKIEVEERSTKNIKRLHLLNTLALLQHGLANRPLFPDMLNYFFANDTISTYNGHRFILAPLKTGFAGGVEAKSFKALIDKLEVNKLQLTLAGDRLAINIEQNIKAEFLFTPSKDMLKRVKGINMEKNWKPFPEDLKTGIILCSFAASHDLTKPELSGVCVTKDMLLAGDNLRTSKFIHTHKDLIEETFIIPADSAVILKQFQIEKFAVDKGWIHFLCKDGVYFAAILVNDKYKFPVKRCLSLFPEKDIRLTSIPVHKELTTALERADVFLSDDHILDKWVALILDRTGIQIKVEKSGKGFYDETIAFTKWKKEPTKTMVNPVFLKEALQFGTKFTVRNKKIILATDTFQHIVPEYK